MMAAGVLSICPNICNNPKPRRWLSVYSSNTILFAAVKGSCCKKNFFYQRQKSSKRLQKKNKKKREKEDFLETNFACANIPAELVLCDVKYVRQKMLSALMTHAKVGSTTHHFVYSRLQFIQSWRTERNDGKAPAERTSASPQLSLHEESSAVSSVATANNLRLIWHYCECYGINIAVSNGTQFVPNLIYSFLQRLAAELSIPTTFVIDTKIKNARDFSREIISEIFSVRCVRLVSLMFVFKCEWSFFFLLTLKKRSEILNFHSVSFYRGVSFIADVNLKRDRWPMNNFFLVVVAAAPVPQALLDTFELKNAHSTPAPGAFQRKILRNSRASRVCSPYLSPRASLKCFWLFFILIKLVPWNSLTKTKCYTNVRK